MVSVPALLESAKIEKADKVLEVFLVCILFEIPEDEAEYYSLGAARRMFRGGRNVNMQIHLFLERLGYYSAIFNGESRAKEVNRYGGNNLHSFFQKF